jgi:hypothetical protein
VIPGAPGVIPPLAIGSALMVMIFAPDVRPAQKSNRAIGKRSAQATPGKNPKSGEDTMKPGQIIRTSSILLAVGLFLTFTVSMMAQVQSETTTTHGPATQKVEVQRAEVVYVSGNDLIVKMENGEIRDIPDIPESAKATVDGKEIGIHEVKVGMKLEKTITTTTTPRIVTKVETVTGKVFHVVPPTSVILTMDNGENQQFKIPPGQKFNIDGQVVDAFHLRKGMNVSATRVTETPETVVTQKAMLTGQMPPPTPPPADVPILVMTLPPPPAPAGEAETAAQPAPAASAAPAAPEAAPQESKTGTYLLIAGLLVVLIVLVGFGWRAFRRT